jgi:hypothetical protein
VDWILDQARAVQAAFIAQARSGGLHGSLTRGLFRNVSAFFSLGFVCGISNMPRQMPGLIFCPGQYDPEDDESCNNRSDNECVYDRHGFPPVDVILPSRGKLSVDMDQLKGVVPFQ